MMKTTIIATFLSLLILQTTIFSMEKNEEIVLENKEIQFTKKDYFKMIAASSGILFFATSAFRAPAITKQLISSDIKNIGTWFNIPALMCELPINFILGDLYMLSEESFFYHLVGGLSGATSGIAAGILGTYVGKKLYQWKRARSFKASDK